MSQITLRKIPDKVERMLRLLSEKQKKSLNKTIISLLEKALGIDENSKKKRELSSFFNTWDKEDIDEFKKNTEVFNKIDKEIWE